MNEFHQNYSCNPGCSPKPCPAPKATGSFLMQRILACGKMHRRCQTYSVCLDSLPCSDSFPCTVVNAAVCGNPSWQEIPCHERGAILLHLFIPLSFQLIDCKGRHFTASGIVEEQIRLHLSCPESECWRGQFFIQAAARLCGNAQICQDGHLDAKLEIVLDAYLLAACQYGMQHAPSCPPPRPWYPQCSLNPWSD